MQPGDLNKLLTIESATTSTGSSGETTRTWAEVATVWASIREDSSSEGASGDRPMPERRYSIVIYLPSGFTLTSHNHRLVYDGRTLDIDGPPLDADSLTARGFLKLYAVERQGEAG